MGRVPPNTNENEVGVDFRKAAIAGVVGTIAFDFTGLLLTGEFWDVPKLLASKLVGDGPLLFGVGLHYLIGVTQTGSYG